MIHEATSSGQEGIYDLCEKAVLGARMLILCARRLLMWGDLGGCCGPIEHSLWFLRFLSRVGRLAAREEALQTSLATRRQAVS